MIAGCQHVLELIANVNVVVANAALEDRSGGGSRWWRSRSQIFGRHGVATLVIQPTPYSPCADSELSRQSDVAAVEEARFQEVVLHRLSRLVLASHSANMTSA